MRFRLLETFRAFSIARLTASCQSSASRSRHLEYFLKLAEEAESRLTGAQQKEWFDRLDKEYYNLRTGLDWALEERSQGPGVGTTRPSVLAPRANPGLRLAAALGRFWMVRGLYDEGRRSTERSLFLSGYRVSSSHEEAAPKPITAAADLKAKAVRWAGHLAYRQGDFGSATRLVNHALDLALHANDRPTEAYAVNDLGNVAWGKGEYHTARLYYEKGLAIRRAIGDPWGIAASLNNVGVIAQEQGEYSKARACHEEALDLRRGLGDTWGMAYSLDNLGAVAREQNQHEEAQLLLEQGLALRRDLGDRRGTAWSLRNLGILARRKRNYARARVLQEEALALCRATQDRRSIAFSLCEMGHLAREAGDSVGARARFSEALAVSREIGDKRGIAESVEGLAHIAGTQDQLQRAGRLFGATAALREAIGAPLPPSDRAEYDRTVAAVRAVLGDPAFTAAYAAGRALPLAAAIQFALEESDGAG
ncbi:MAG: tetratricopeptide repeat protein [bacterium]